MPADHAVGRRAGDQVVERAAPTLGGDRPAARTRRTLPSSTRSADVLAGRPAADLAPPLDCVGPGRVEADLVAVDAPRRGRGGSRSRSTPSATVGVRRDGLVAATTTSGWSGITVAPARRAPRDDAGRRPALTSCSIFMLSSAPPPGRHAPCRRRRRPPTRCPATASRSGRSAASRWSARWTVIDRVLQLIPPACADRAASAPAGGGRVRPRPGRDRFGPPGEDQDPLDQRRTDHHWRDRPEPEPGTGSTVQPSPSRTICSSTSGWWLSAAIVVRRAEPASGAEDRAGGCASRRGTSPTAPTSTARRSSCRAGPARPAARVAARSISRPGQRLGRLDAHDEVELAVAQAARAARPTGRPTASADVGTLGAERGDDVGEVDDGGDVDHADPDPTAAARRARRRTSRPGRAVSASTRRAWSSTGAADARSTRRRPCDSNSGTPSRRSSSARPCDSADGLTPTALARRSAHVGSSATATRYSSWRIVRSGSGQPHPAQSSSDLLHNRSTGSPRLLTIPAHDNTSIPTVCPPPAASACSPSASAPSPPP